MSSRVYNLRTRIDTATAASPLVQNTDVAAALYSDVVASRPPSPRKENSTSPAKPVEHPSKEIDSEGVFGYSKTEQKTANENERISNSLSSDESELPKELENQWTTVKRRRARSLDSQTDYRVPKISGVKETPAETLTRQQVRVVQAAEQALNPKQNELVQRRREKVVGHQQNSQPSRGEGPSRSKGKGIDLREWGNVNISRESLDVEAQAAALESFAAQQPVKGIITKEKWPRVKDEQRIGHSRRDKRPAVSRPAAQIAKNSYLGKALRDVDHSGTSNSDGGSSPSSSPSSSSTDSSEASETNEEDSETSDYDSSRDSSPPRPRKRNDNRHGRKKKRQRASRSSKSPKSSIKPIPPLEYDGKPDAHAYHRFVKESGAYLKDGKVRGQRKVFLLSYYLTGKAYDFYTQD